MIRHNIIWYKIRLGHHFTLLSLKFTTQYRHETRRYEPRAQNLRQGIVMKTSFETRVSQMGLGSFVDINMFVIKYY